MIVINSQTDIDDLVDTLIENLTDTVTITGLTIADFIEDANPDFSGLNRFNKIIIDGDFIITNNNFTKFDLNKNITTVNGNIEITDNSYLRNISKFSKLITLGGGITISNNPSINFLPDIPYLNIVNGDFIISNMKGILYILSNFCSYLHTITGNLKIYDNDNLIHIDGFTNTSNENPFNIIGQLQIYGNRYLIDIMGFTGINPSENIDISNNPNLCEIQYINTIPPIENIKNVNFKTDGEVTCITQSQLDELSNIKIITGDLTISGFTPDFFKLSNLIEIGGTLIIRDNIINTNFNHFNSLKIICGDLHIINNTGLSGILGFVELITIGGNIYISNNELSSISGFGKITNIYNIDNINNTTTNNSFIASGVSNIQISSIILNTFQIPSNTPIPKKKQTISNYKTAEDVISRRVIMKSWNTANAVGVINNHARITSPFPSIYNRTDFLSRKKCDGTNVPCANTNVKYVPDSSLYTRYKREVMANKNFNT